MIVYNGEVLFNGWTAAPGHGLWAWNGTSATELVSGIDPSNFAINNGVVLFSGLDSNGHAQLLETNGQVGGTSEVAAGASGRRWLHLRRLRFRQIQYARRHFSRDAFRRSFLEAIGDQKPAASP